MQRTKASTPASVRPSVAATSSLKRPAPVLSGRITKPHIQGATAAPIHTRKRPGLGQALVAQGTDRASEVSQLAQRLRDSADCGDMEQVGHCLDEVERRGLGPDVWMQADDKGRTALHLAAVRGHVTVVRELVKRGAHVHVSDVNGNTPLHLAVVANHVSVVCTLLEAGASPLIFDKLRKSPLDMAQSRLQFLRQRSVTADLDQVRQAHTDLVTILNSYLKRRDTVAIQPCLLDTIPEFESSVGTAEHSLDLDGLQDLMDQLRLMTD